MITSQNDLTALVQDLVGAEYALHRSSMDDGFDCLTLVREVLNRLGETFPLPSEYDDGEIPAEAFATWRAHFTPCGPDVGAIVDFGGDHLGVIITASPRQFIHAQRGAGVVINRLGSVMRRRNVVRGFYRVKRA